MRILGIIHELQLREEEQENLKREEGNGEREREIKDQLTLRCFPCEFRIEMKKSIDRIDCGLEGRLHLLQLQLITVANNRRVNPSSHDPNPSISSFPPHLR